MLNELLEIELLDNLIVCKQMILIELLVIHRNTCNI